MADTSPEQIAPGTVLLDFATSPERYKHWKLTVSDRVAKLELEVQENETFAPGYELKLNSYDLGVDIKLHAAVQRLRFEHPEVAAVVITSAKPRIFCAGANIGMLARSSHAEKVNFCKFTNETRMAIEDATQHSGQTYICAINGAAAGGGYELALACDHIMLIDDGSSTVSLPELPLLAVLPGTGGLTRLVNKRGVRPDHADFLCTTSEGIRGKRALDWHLVDELVAPSRFDETVMRRAQELAERSDRPPNGRGIELPPLHRTLEPDRITYRNLSVELDRDMSAASFTVRGPVEQPPLDPTAIHAAGASFWPLALAREMEDAILHLRANEPELGTWVFRTVGDSSLVEAADSALLDNADDWLVREITLYLKRTFKRLGVSSRSLFALIEPGSCFTGTLLELALAADRSYMLDGTFEGSPLAAATVRVGGMNLGPLPTANGLTRLESRFHQDPTGLEAAKQGAGRDLEAKEAADLGLVTFAPDDIDWEDEVRLAMEERSSFSPDALTGMEANLRFAGPETMESKIFGRNSAWQNWIFQRPNATGEQGALTLYGTGRKSRFDRKRT